MKLICLQSWAPIRKEGASTSELVNSLLFGETCTVLSEADEWLQVSCDYDGYIGFIPSNYLYPCTDYFEGWKIVLASQSANLVHGLGRIHLSAGSYLPDSDEVEIFDKKFKLTIRDSITPTEAWQIAKGFLYTPYFWGGRSDCGIDCSGLTQVVLKIIGKKIPRDASQQAEIGTLVSWENKEDNDLVFFANNSKVTHVGILAPNNEIIHASGRVRKDAITPEGIINLETGKLTHVLHSIKRL